MKTMSTLTFRDNLAKFKQQYAAMRTKTAKGKTLDSLCQTYGCSRKYLNKLLRGKRVYRPHRGRGPSYGEEERKLLGRLWAAAGRPCPEYLKTMLARTASDYSALGNEVRADALGKVLRMSVSTIGRSLKRDGVAGYRRNKTSGMNALKSSIPECPGSELPEDSVGTCQVDTVFLCGGNMAGSFFSIGSLTDALTQWFECAPTWNHGGENTAQAMLSIVRRLPFDILHMHPDNGSEFINYIFIGKLAEAVTGCRISRSRAYRKNDNCRIEQKNGSVVREYFSDIRFDRIEQYDALKKVCMDIALYTNLFRPCKKLVSKRRKESKGVRYIKKYDKPSTPLERLLAVKPADPRVRRYLDQYSKTNSITLYKSIQSQLRRLVRELHSVEGGSGIPQPPSTESAVRPHSTFRHRSVSTHLTEAVCN